ncbi:ATP-binding protein [Negadavirga shengliensis]|uniref:ATP-binding protein n=1 Tax=Negadavirga shengliensis TaxID=1389218 RepID=A0ABV9T2U7_9BACT
MSETKIEVSLSWSGGKDSALALWYLLQNADYQVVGLHTVFGEETRRVGMHGIHEDLIVKQSHEIGLPLDKIYLPASGDNQAYEKAMTAYLDRLAGQNIRHLAYGDIFLEDLKKYREEKLAQKGMRGIFPLWGKDTGRLSSEFLGLGFTTVICAADADKIPQENLGAIYGRNFLGSLPADVDPCGENGEFHTFCCEGPIFKNPIAVVSKEPVRRAYTFKDSLGQEQAKYFWFSEIELAEEGSKQ